MLIGEAAAQTRQDGPVVDFPGYAKVYHLALRRRAGDNPGGEASEGTGFSAGVLAPHTNGLILVEFNTDDTDPPTEKVDFGLNDVNITLSGTLTLTMTPESGSSKAPY